MGTIATVTIGTDTFSVYAKTSNAVTDATTFFNGLLGAEATAFAAATTDNKKRGLVMAADWIDRAVGQQFSGTKTVSTQGREFPRDGATYWGTALTDGTTPDNLANAEFWLAGRLLLDSAAAAGTGTGSNVKEVKAGSASVAFFSATLGSSSDTRLPITAMDYLRGYFDSAGVTGAAGVDTGTSGESAFADDDFELDQGFS